MIVPVPGMCFLVFLRTVQQSKGECTFLFLFHGYFLFRVVIKI